MSSLEDRRDGYRGQVAGRGNDFLVIIAFCLAGLLLSGLVAVFVASDPVLHMWTATMT